MSKSMENATSFQIYTLKVFEFPRVLRLDSGIFQCLNLWKNPEVSLLGLGNCLGSNGVSSQAFPLASLLKVMIDLIGTGVPISQN